MSFRSLFLLLLFCANPLLSWQARAASAPAPRRTNLLLITIDTLRPDHLGCYGDRQARTPNIDALAAAGTRFDQAYTPVPITLPSHTVMMTGTYPMYTGIHDFSGNRLNPRQPTLASILGQQGYATGAVLGSAVLDHRFGLNQGFDFYYDHFDFNRLEDANLDLMKRPGNEVVDQALQWLSGNAGRPFFLWVHLYDAHTPYDPPPPFDREYPGRPYDGEIAFADQQVGRLLRFLKEKQVYGRTLIVLAGDHGESLGEHGEKNHGFFIYDATLHIPFVVKLPAGQRQQSAVGQPASTLDLLQTVLEVLKVPAPDDAQGASLLPVILGKPLPAGPPPELYSESFLPLLHFDWSELRGIQIGRYHYIDVPKPELYDISSDPGEVHNLYTEKPAIAQELKARLDALEKKDTAGQQQAQSVPLDPVLMERLKSLGYAGFSGGHPAKAGDSRRLPDPKDRIAMFELVSDAIDASQHGRYQESTSKLIQALKTEETCVPVHYLLGLDYYRTQNFPDSIREFRRVLELSPDYTLVYFYLGLAYARTGDYADSIDYLQRTLKADGTNFSAAYNLGAAYLKLNRVDEAVAAFRQSLQIYSGYEPAHLALGEVLLYQQKLDDALAELRQAVALAPNDPRAHAVLAKALQAKGLNAEAAQEMEKAAAARGQRQNR
ncbi:MAG TPA: sulfatase-like hydrolase/transferase [Terriglobales bacterium]|nr:sulfatase-like hydrolase/transferase [Terriglobales bacterium]